MNIFSKEICSSGKRRKISSNTNEVTSNVVLGDLPEDVILIAFRYLSFPALCRVKTVCKWWMQHVNKAVDLGLGNKPFLTNEELVKAARDHYNYKWAPGPAKVFRDHIVEKLATIYGWPIGKWDVSQVTNFSRVFEDQIDFNDYIGDWDVSQGTTFEGMFHNAYYFDQDLGNWNISKATTLNCMFCGASCFNKDLTKWNTSNVENMCNMFCRAINFNGDVSNFDTSKVIYMCQMFMYARAFNQNISSWDTSNVSGMDEMFKDARDFCQNISSWDVRSVYKRYRYDEVFDGATSFNREYSPSF
mmetsp:Transcript_6285/g.9666  ORF Transcript_6285/g.9666 Transcript_6285/m.9666 type:complete len:302 (+) Transcript_6285:87-992(+)